MTPVSRVEPESAHAEEALDLGTDWSELGEMAVD